MYYHSREYIQMKTFTNEYKMNKAPGSNMNKMG